VELFTLRKFIETRGRESAPAELAATLEEIDRELPPVADRSTFDRGIEAEITLIRSMAYT
jgi:hypothetical protein